MKSREEDAWSHYAMVFQSRHNMASINYMSYNMTYHKHHIRIGYEFDSKKFKLRPANNDYDDWMRFQYLLTVLYHRHLRLIVGIRSMTHASRKSYKLSLENIE